MKKTLPLIALALLFQAGAAQAATRTICYDLLFKDERTDCPTSADAGVRRACQENDYNFTSAPDGTYTHPVGSHIEIWDRDWNSDDEYIGTWYIGGTGTRCVTFEWEGASYSKGEANPDIYIKWKSKTQATVTGAKTVQAIDDTGANQPNISWRSYQFDNCTRGSTCTFPYYLLISTDATTERGGYAQVLDSTQHALEVYNSYLDHNIEVVYPGPSSFASSQTKFTIGGTSADNRALMAQSSTHEMGHVLQMQLFNQNYLRNNCNLGGSTHSLTSEEYESCATTEGWAGYVAAVSLWNPNNTGSRPSRWGLDFENATPFSSTCSDNGSYELQVIRAFWDLDDANNEAASSPAAIDDLYNSSSTFIASGWGQFANGTGNRDDYESGNDGVNVWDYYYNNSSRFGNATNARHTLLYHNCLSSQATN